MPFSMNLRDVVVYGKDEAWYRVLAFNAQGNVVAYLMWPDDPEDEELLEFRRIGLDPLLAYVETAASDLAFEHRITAIQHLSPWPFHD
jgi:hypothetical protein